MKKITLRSVVVTAVMGAVGAILMYLEFSIPLMPSFIKLDISELPALVTAFAFGPLYGVVDCLIKNLLHLAASQSAGIGELANFLLDATFCLAAGSVYRFFKSRKGAVASCIIASVVMALVSFPINWFLTYPFYIKVYFGGDTAAVVEMYRTIWPGVHNLWQCLLVFNLPFTLVKGLLVCAICFVIYKPLSAFLKGKS